MQIKPLKIVLIYGVFSILWVFYWNRYIVEFSEVLRLSVEAMGVAKSIFFVTCTSLLLYFLIRKQQKNLIDSEKQYRSLFFTNPNPHWIYDEETLKFLEVNQAAIQIYGYAAEEFLQMTILDIRKKEDHAKLKAVLKNNNSNVNVSGNWEHIKKNGETLFAYVSSHKTVFNSRKAVLVMAQDVTLQLQQEEKLKMLYATEKELKEELEKNIELIEYSLAEKQRFIEIVDRVQNMVTITDPEGTITWVNQAFTNFTGYSMEEVLGKKTDFLHGPETDVTMQGKIMNGVRKNSFSIFEILNYTKSGEKYWVEITISAVYNHNSEVMRYISVGNVITERKLRDDQILKQNEVLKKLAWTNSHAIRKPVASILGLVDLSKDISQVKDMKEVHELIGVCALELDEVTKQIAKVMEHSEPDQIKS